MRLVAVFAVLGTSQFFFLIPSANAASANCKSTPNPPYEATTTVTTLTPANDHTTKPPTITFGTSRVSQAVAPYTFTVTGPAPDPTKMSWDFLLLNGNETFPGSDASVTFSTCLATCVSLYA